MPGRNEKDSRRKRGLHYLRFAVWYNCLQMGLCYSIRASLGTIPSCPQNGGVTLLFGSEPFSTFIRMSNFKEWRYDWIWKKNTSAGFVHAKNRPLKNYEIISAFCCFGMGHKSTMGDKRMPYNPQGLRPCHKITHNALNKFGGVLSKRPSQKKYYRNGMGKLSYVHS